MRYRIDPDLLRTVLPMLARDGRQAPHVVSVAVRKVLVGRAYSADKLHRCRVRLGKERATVAPVLVSRYWLYDEDYLITGNDSYLLEDSIHRVVAARDCGYTRIRATIHADYLCQPNMYRLDATTAMLWRQSDNGWQFIKNELTVEQIHALRLVGVGAMVYGQSTLRRDIFQHPITQ